MVCTKSDHPSSEMNRTVILAKCVFNTCSQLHAHSKNTTKKEYILNLILSISKDKSS